MRPRSLGSLTPFATAVAMVLVCECVAPGTAEAGCGDYVHVGRTSTRMPLAEGQPLFEDLMKGEESRTRPAPAPAPPRAVAGERDVDPADALADATPALDAGDAACRTGQITTAA